MIVGNNISIVNPASESVEIQKDKKQQNFTGISFSEMLYNHQKLNKKIEKQNESDQEEQKKTDQVNTNLIHRQYMMMEQLIPLKKKEEEKK